ncbi:MAG: Gfo/Idh/MocA family protein [Candidatus Promineifilaceae bacterium]
MSKTVKIGIVGTSWWVDAMYLPPLDSYESAEVVAICGRNRERAEARAAQWNIPHVFTDFREMLASGLFEAVIIATGNETHHAITMAALENDLHVLCEKPLALNYADSAEMTATAAAKNRITMTPFTYRNMPSTRYIKELINDGFIGQPYHLHLRYYAGYGRDGSEYNWRFDNDVAGSGALGDIASHFLHLAEWFYGEVDAVCSNLGAFIERPALNPKGEPYTQGDDTAMLMLRFKNGAHGMVHATTLAYENTAFGQQHEMDLHGSNGTLRQIIDWNARQQIMGGRVGEETVRELPIPEHIWGNLRRENVIETYKDVFRKEGRMVREFVDAVRDGISAESDFAAGARVQAMLEAALQSAKTGAWVSLAEITESK